MYTVLPGRKIVNPQDRDNRVVAYIYGPDDKSHEANLYELAAARATSTYPTYPGSSVKQGEPICDAFSMKLYDTNRAVIAIADGCNWGQRPKEAATRATTAFMTYVEKHQHEMQDVRDVGHYLLRAFDVASREILKGKAFPWEAGTTTLLGGLLVQLDEPAAETVRYAFVCVNVGDCKVFKWSIANDTVMDITQGNRSNLTDARDPGGCLGPHKDSEPDLRNLQLYFSELEPEDILIFLTDGVHDNLDPQTLGKSPREFDLASDSWEEAEKVAPKETEAAKRAYQEKLVSQFITKARGEHKTPSLKSVTGTLLRYCTDLTEPSRKWMEDNPGKKLPPDLITYPGKMDHATVMCFRVPHRVLPDAIMASPMTIPLTHPLHPQNSGSSSPPPSSATSSPTFSKSSSSINPKRASTEKKHILTSAANQKNSKSEPNLLAKAGKQEIATA